MRKVESPEEKRRKAIGMIIAFGIVYLFVQSKKIKLS
tara:strand:+ start:6422 stop:6532 length:111 start_codon:yes stop_codon:yes gene_type:complete